jgi:hypothetical protein|tara:strand:+ start:2371 stop:2586 length:216 start_codon:yes stop_codon:yes gene_type:complete
MIEKTEKVFKKVEYVFTTDYTNVLIADISFIIVLLALAFFWEEQRTLMFVGFSLYSLFSVLWHFPPGIMTY